MNFRLTQLPLETENDVALARHLATRAAALASLSIYDQARLATAVSEIAGNAVKHARAGQVEFSVSQPSRRQFIQVLVSDQGSGIPNLKEMLHQQPLDDKDSPRGIFRARRLVDRFSIDSHPKTGTFVLMAKAMPVEVPTVTAEVAAQWATTLEAEAKNAPSQIAPLHQNHELYEALAELRQKERDLKRQLRKVQQLNEKLDVLSLVASKTDNAVVITDRDGFIEWVNDGFTRITGYELYDVVGKKPGQILQGPLTDPAAVERIRQGLASGKSFTEEVLNYRKSGEPYWISLNILPVYDRSRKIARYISLQNDVTAHKQSEQDLRAAKQAAEMANQAKSEFLANMSHEIRTPMNAIIGMTALALETNLNSTQRDYLVTVKESAESLLGLLDDILDFSKIEAGRFELDASPFSLRDCLALSMKALAIRAHEKGLELVCDVDSAVPDMLVGDPLRLRQIVVNLVGNAIKFTRQGEVLVSVALRGRSPSALELEFHVRDTGIGIAPESHAKVFEAFSQADNSTTRQFGGTGLGLAITNRLVGMMNGRIWLESELGQGSTFAFTIELGQAEAAQIAHAGAEAGLAGTKAVVVDDNAASRKVLVKLLRSWNVETLEAADLADARQTVAEQNANLVVIDAGLADEDGFALIDQLQANGARPAMVMLLTTVHRARDVARCQTLPGVSYANKPVSESNLLAAVLRATGRATDPTSGETEPAAVVPESQLNVLLVEDTPANQKLVMRILAKRGHRVEIARTGREAIELYAANRFDAVLMDVQMPEMDGFTATREIRKLEKRLGRYAVVIAMTAHAMKGDRERCLAAGMNHYLAKPIDGQELLRLLDRLGAAIGSPEEARLAGMDDSLPLTREPDVGEPHLSLQVVDPSIPYDYRKAIKRLGGDDQLFRDLIGFFSSDAPKLLDDLRQGIERRAWHDVERAAHSLKGLSTNFEATAAASAARDVEEAAPVGDISLDSPLLARLDAEVHRLREALALFVAERASEEPSGERATA